jgi:7-cyano-7-deazaguanine synthase in queuosine biosynthesis
MEAYINLSGGVDSTYYLWRWLKENPDKKILVHHCVFGRVRNEVEKEASEKIIEWLKKKGHNNFQYVTTTFHKGNVRGSLFDVVAIGAVSGVVLRCYKTVEKVLLPYCFEETAIIRKHLEHSDIRSLENTHRTGCFMDSVEATSGRKMEFLPLYMDRKKADMIAEMPSDLVKLTWFCRKPQKGKPCTKCFNCRRVLPHLKKKR